MIDLYAIHEKKAGDRLLTIHPSRWLRAGRQLGRGGVFDLLSRERQVIRVGGQIVEHFRQLCDVGLDSKVRHKHGYYFATAAVADRYFKHVPEGGARECAVRDMLAVAEPDGQIEVRTPVGFIDFLLPTAIVEVKEVNKWKHAVGQVLAYSTYYPDRTKAIHLYGPHGQIANSEECLRVCAQFDIGVRYQCLLPSELGAMSRLRDAVVRV
ncbi:hypothetical protein N5J06_18745 [Ralstonia sp. CHL-2022]|uniref:Uncharacterized protein n=1 Tax=Ralstonia mojiangensis TaxID=2953895 RepID=A0ABT2LC78_9RALS|nr:hypothetical protein [Ralstonia mojiangensis]MCT7313016.1 hypothetical protein [Ralstonia mojiangensis]